MDIQNTAQTHYTARHDDILLGRIVELQDELQEKDAVICTLQTRLSALMQMFEFKIKEKSAVSPDGQKR